LTATVIPFIKDPTYLQDLLNAVDGRGEQRADLLVIIDIVCVSQTHEQNVGRQTWDQIHGNTARFQLWRDRGQSGLISDFGLQTE